MKETIPPEPIPPLEELNRTELEEMLRRQTGGIIKRSVPLARLVELLESSRAPDPQELAGTVETRHNLEVWIAANIVQVGSQIPCKGPDRGKCSIYPCPESRHVDCHDAASASMRMERGSK